MSNSAALGLPGSFRGLRRSLGLLNRDHRVVFLSLFLWSLGSGLYWPLWAPHAMALGANPRQVGLLFAVMFAASGVGLALGTLVADRWERRFVIILSWWIGVPAALFYALARSWRGFLPGVLLFGASFFSNPALAAYVGSQARPGAVSRTVSYTFMSFSIGMAVGPVIGGLIAERFSVSCCYYLATLMFLGSTAVIYFIHPQDPRQASTGGRSADPGPRPGAHAWPTGELLRVFAISLWFGVIFVLAGIPSNFVTPYLAQVGSYRPSRLGVAGSAVSTGAAAFTLAFGALGDLLGNPVVVCTALGVLCASNLIFIASLGMPLVLLSCFARGALDGARGCMTAEVIHAGSSQYSGRNIGCFYVVTSLAATASPYLGGILYAAAPRLPFIVSAASMIPLAAGLVLIERFVRNRGSRFPGRT